LEKRERNFLIEQTKDLLLPFSINWALHIYKTILEKTCITSKSILQNIGKDLSYFKINTPKPKQGQIMTIQQTTRNLWNIRISGT
jgi:hypothetical protein